MTDVSLLKDFYVDLEGDIKAVTDEFVCTFITTNDKLNSKYLFAENIEEIKDAIKKINPGFVLDINIFKEYSVKTNNNGEIKAIKIFADSNNHQENNMELVLTGFELFIDKIIKDEYFLSNEDDIKNYINTHFSLYEYKNYETHKPILYSIKSDITTGTLINFKTYYVRNENAMYYNKDMVNILKQTLRFS